jgi:hypothetical protein
MRSLVRFLPTILIALCFVPGHLFHHALTGPGMSLWNRLVLGIPCAWLLAMLVGSLSLCFTRTLPERKRILILTISTVVLFFPLRGLSRGVAEELELPERIRTGYQSDEGISYMYGEMSERLAFTPSPVVLSRACDSDLLASSRLLVQPLDSPIL